MPPSNRAADSHEIRPLTGIRGFAAIAVVLFHFYASWVLLLPPLRTGAMFASRGHLGVDLFFILSGFILSYVYRAGDAKFGISEYRKFIWFRLARIYPNHVATSALLFLMVVVAGYAKIRTTGDYPVTRLPFQLAMLHALPAFGGGSWNYPSWSISAEWFAYLCIFPISWWLLRRKFGAAGFFAFGYTILVFWLVLSATVAMKPYGAILQVSCEFLAGSMLFGAYWHGHSISRVCHRVTTIVFAVLLGIMALAPSHFALASPAIVGLVPLLLIGLTSEESVIAKILCSPPVMWLGRLSYAMYMSHALAQKFLKVALPAERYTDSGVALRICVLFAHVAIIFAFTGGLYFLVEIPSRNYFRRVAHRWSVRQSTPVAQIS